MRVERLKSPIFRARDLAGFLVEKSFYRMHRMN